MKASQPGSLLTQEVFLWWRRHNESIWSMFFRKFLIEAEEVAEASPHSKCLAAEHGQCGLKQTERKHISGSDLCYSFTFQELLV